MSEIKFFDVLVHPDFHLSRGYSSLTSSHIRRRQRWDTRIAMLANDPEAVLFYSSAFLMLQAGNGGPVLIRDADLAAYEVDRKRILQYREQLGERFILFTGDQKPSSSELKKILDERGFFYTSAEAMLVAYGEYSGACVASWRRYMTIGLGLKKHQSFLEGKLSLPVEEVRFTNFKNIFRNPAFVS